MTSTCRRCGAQSDEGGDEGLPSGWSLATEDGRVDRLCDRCTREHVRSIEAKLPDEWW